MIYFYFFIRLVLDGLYKKHYYYSILGAGINGPIKKSLETPNKNRNLIGPKKENKKMDQSG